MRQHHDVIFFLFLGFLVGIQLSKRFVAWGNQDIMEIRLLGQIQST